MLPVAVAQSSSDDTAVCYVLPVVWITVFTCRLVTPHGDECTRPLQLLYRQYALLIALTADDCIRCLEG